MSIGENIKSLRESRGLTQAQLGDAVGVSDKAVSTWESGKREPRMGAWPATVFPLWMSS